MSVDGRLSEVAQGLYESLLSGEPLDESWSQVVLAAARETGEPQEQIISEALLEIDALMGHDVVAEGNRRQLSG